MFGGWLTVRNVSDVGTTKARLDAISIEHGFSITSAQMNPAAAAKRLQVPAHFFSTVAKSR
jgi:hypothetical protein